MAPLTKRATWMGTALLIVGTLVEVLADPAVFSPLASLIGPTLAPKIGALVAVLGGITAAMGRALGDTAPPAPEETE